MSLRRRVFALLVTTSFVVGACGTASPTASPSSPASQAPSESAGASQAASETPPPSQAAESADFKYLIDGEPSTFAGVSNDLPTQWFDIAVYNALYTANNKLEMVPDLAAALPETSADGLTWTVKIKPNVKFHDGTQMTADDVKFNFDLLMSKNCNQNSDVCSSIADNVDSITVSDPTTVVFKLKQKFAPFLTTGLGAVYIMPKKALEDSLARFQGNVASLDAAKVAATDKKVQDAINADACSGDKAPDSCKASGYLGEMEPLLQQAKIQLPDKAAYKDDKGNPDNEAYAAAVATQLNDLAKSLKASQIDQIAASLKILDFANKPIGTGPYKFVKYSAGQSVELARNDDFYGNKVGPARVFIPIIKEAATGSAALQKGEINWQSEITSDALNKVKGDPNLFTVEFPDFGYYYIGFNVRPGKLYADKNLRTAFTMCIDHDKTVQVATDGQGIPVYANTPPASWAFNTNVPKYTLDVDGAKKLIEQSGWTLGSDGVYAKDGKKLSTKLYVRAGRPQRVSFAQLAKDQLKECGINVDVVEADFAAVLIPQVVNYPNNFDTYLGGWSSSIDPDDFSLFHSSHISTADNKEDNNFIGWKNDQADQLLVQGRQELDQNKRKDIYAQFQVLIHNEAPYYFLWADKHVAGFTKTVQGEIDKQSPLYYWNMSTWTVQK